MLHIDVEWRPIYMGKRHGRCSTRAWKTMNRRAIRYERKHGTFMQRVVTGELRRYGGMRWVNVHFP